MTADVQPVMETNLLRERLGDVEITATDAVEWFDLLGSGGRSFSLMWQNLDDGWKTSSPDRGNHLSTVHYARIDARAVFDSLLSTVETARAVEPLEVDADGPDGWKTRDTAIEARRAWRSWS